MKNESQVVILLATYNGEKFIREQLDSILNQTYTNFKLRIRDDGSKDKTVSILQEYAEKDSRISYYTGENLRAAGCFYDLICNSADADYYAFCDQDDVWEENKLEVAITQLEKGNKEVPTLYLSNLKVVDEKLNFLKNRHEKPIKTDSKYYPLVEFLAVGCTQVFNKKALELVRNHLPGNKILHDAWMFLSCSFFGKIIYDFEPHILYRQHSNNVVGHKTKKIDRLKEKFKRLFDRSIQPRKEQAKIFLEAYNDLLGDEAHYVKKIVDYKRGLIKRLSLLFNRKIKASSFGRDFKYRLLILWGAI